MFSQGFNYFIFSGWRNTYYFFASVIAVPAGIGSASVTRVLSLKMGGIKKVVEIRLNKKKKHNKYFMLGKSKINNIENLISQASIDLETSH